MRKAREFDPVGSVPSSKRLCPEIGCLEITDLGHDQGQTSDQQLFLVTFVDQNVRTVGAKCPPRASGRRKSHQPSGPEVFDPTVFGRCLWSQLFMLFLRVFLDHDVDDVDDLNGQGSVPHIPVAVMIKHLTAPAGFGCFVVHFFESWQVLGFPHHRCFPWQV